MVRNRKQQPRYRGELLLGRFMDFCYESQVAARPVHIALYAHILTVYNKCGWLEVFNLETVTAMQRARIFNRNTYYKTIADLVEWGWIKDYGRDKSLCRSIGLTDGVDAQAYNRALSAQEQPEQPQQTTTSSTSAIQPETRIETATSDADMEQFERVFDAWANNVTNPSTWVDKRWLETATKDTGIHNFALAMHLFKEHIIKFSKVKEWLGKSLEDKKSYFIFASKHFMTSECKIVKQVVAKIIDRDGKSFVQQYGALLPLPSNYPPQPDVDYYWDGSWNNWRQA